MRRDQGFILLTAAVVLLAGQGQAQAQELTQDPQAYKQEPDVPQPEGQGPKSRRPLDQAPAKISPKLSRLGSSQRAQVMIVFRQRPQKDIVERIEAAAGLYREPAEAEFVRLVKQPWAVAPQIRQARERLDQITLQTRNAARQEIEREIGSFQQYKMARLEGAGATRLERFWTHNMIAAEVPSEVLDQLAADEDVAEVFPLEQISLAAVSNESIDPNVGVLGLAAWWNEGYTGAGQSVAVLDTGIRSSHPVFRNKEIIARSFLGRIRSNPCFADSPSSPEDFHGHGTHVAGIIAGAGSQYLPFFQGTAPEVDKIYALKVGARLSGEGGCGDNAIDTGDVLSAVEWAITNSPAKIYNMSFGGSADGDDSGLARVIDYLADVYGLTIVVAAGNSGRAGDSSPIWRLPAPISFRRVTATTDLSA